MLHVSYTSLLKNRSIYVSPRMRLHSKYFRKLKTEVSLLHLAFYYFVFLFQERSSLLRKWYDLMIQNKDDLAKIITAESVSAGTNLVLEETVQEFLEESLEEPLTSVLLGS